MSRCLGFRCAGHKLFHLAPHWAHCMTQVRPQPSWSQVCKNLFKKGQKMPQKGVEDKKNENLQRGH